MNLKTQPQQMLASIKELLTSIHLTELDLSVLDPESIELTYVIWYDNDGHPYDDPVLKVALKDGKLSLEVDARNFRNTIYIYEDDFADKIEWLTSLLDNMVEVLRLQGIAVNLPVSDPFRELADREWQWQKEVRTLLIDTLRNHGGRISVKPKSPREEYPVTTTLYGQYDYPRIDISDLYLSEDGGQLLADGYEVDGCPREKRCGFSIHNEHLADTFSFIRHIINN